MRRRPVPTVYWVPASGVTRAELLAVPCPTCNVTIGQECGSGGGVPFPLPHRERALHAEVFGFRDLDGPGPLFKGETDATAAADARGDEGLVDDAREGGPHA